MAMQTAFGLHGRLMHSSFAFAAFELSAFFAKDSFSFLPPFPPPPVLKSPKNLSTSSLTCLPSWAFSASVWFSSKFGSRPMMVPVSWPVTTSISTSVTLPGRKDFELAFSARETAVPLVVANIFNGLERGESRIRVSMFRILKGWKEVKEVTEEEEEKGRRWRFKSSDITREGNNTAGCTFMTFTAPIRTFLFNKGHPDLLRTWRSDLFLIKNWVALHVIVWLMIKCKTQ